mmetsp:Transcript_14111/g.33312  ORF Transcript_14111/g.33312 Transcript_14111/m.33312 type:complete len:251 (+) Transcript_14111:4689-5441(+)
MIAPYTKTLRITIPSTGDEAVMKVKVNCVAWVLTRTQTHAKVEDALPVRLKAKVQGSGREHFIPLGRAVELIDLPDPVRLCLKDSHTSHSARVYMKDCRRSDMAILEELAFSSEELNVDENASSFDFENVFLGAENLPPVQEGTLVSFGSVGIERTVEFSVQHGEFYSVQFAERPRGRSVEFAKYSFFFLKSFAFIDTPIWAMMSKPMNARDLISILRQVSSTMAICGLRQYASKYLTATKTCALYRQIF